MERTVWRRYSNTAPVWWLGRDHINFSDSNRPDHPHVHDFAEGFEENSMLPAPYLLLHPETRLSAAEKQQLEGSLMKLAQAYGE